MAEFYGIVIYMYYSDHGKPHFHAIYGGHEAAVSIRGVRVLQGGLPARALALVRAWARIHSDELDANWELARQGIPLNPIAPLE